MVAFTAQAEAKGNGLQSHAFGSYLSLGKYVGGTYNLCQLHQRFITFEVVLVDEGVEAALIAMMG